MLYWPLISAGLFIVCLASFARAMRTFFVQPAGDNSGMKTIRASGTVFALMHLVAILWIPAASQWRALLGICLYASALALFHWALRTHGQRALSSAFSPDVPSHLVTAGPYRYVRHPFYTAYLATWTAGMFVSAAWWLPVTVLVMLWIYFRAARIEEKKFESSSLADEYLQYSHATGMFLPSLRQILRRRNHAAALAQHRA